MKKMYYATSFMAIVLLTSCGNKTTENRPDGFASFESSMTETEVYITPYGKRYHHNWCRTIQGHSVKTISLENTEQRGRTPCHVCY